MWLISTLRKKLNAFRWNYYLYRFDRKNGCFPISFWCSCLQTFPLPHRKKKVIQFIFSVQLSLKCSIIVNCLLVFTFSRFIQSLTHSFRHCLLFSHRTAHLYIWWLSVCCSICVYGANGLVSLIKKMERKLWKKNVCLSSKSKDAVNFTQFQFVLIETIRKRAEQQR